MLKKKTRNFKSNLVFLLAILVLIIIAKYIDNTEIAADEVKENNIIVSNANLKVYYLDVGEADCTLITNNNQTMLIDAGNNEDGKLIVDFIKTLGIEKIDYLVGTHAHEDHIGGLDNIIKSFEIGTVYFPYTTEKTTTTRTFEEIIDNLVKKNLSITTINIGDTFNVGDTNCEIMYVDNKEPEDTNEQSICIRLLYGKQSFLFMGDATQIVEQKRNWPNTTVLKVSHHGAGSSTSKSFLNQVKPQIAIISVGKDNDYGHPKDSVLKRLKNINAKVYRTDKLGTILITSDGENYELTNFETNTDGN